jgi:hypothetical protein
LYAALSGQSGEVDTFTWIDFEGIEDNVGQMHTNIRQLNTSLPQIIEINDHGQLVQQTFLYSTIGARIVRFITESYATWRITQMELFGEVHRMLRSTE